MIKLTLSKMLLLISVTAFVLTCGAANASDTVALVDSQKVMFQHPRFDEASRILLFLSRPLEGGAPQLLLSERNPERRQLITNFSTQITAFAELDRAISAEQNAERRDRLWMDRQNRLGEFEASLMGPIFEECSQAIREVMTLRGMTVALELESVFYGGTDITEEVIQQMRSQIR